MEIEATVKVIIETKDFVSQEDVESYVLDCLSLEESGEIIVLDAFAL